MFVLSKCNLNVDGVGFLMHLINTFSQYSKYALLKFDEM